MRQHDSLTQKLDHSEKIQFYQLNEFIQLFAYIHKNLISLWTYLYFYLKKTKYQVDVIRLHVRTSTSSNLIPTTILSFQIRRKNNFVYDLKSRQWYFLGDTAHWRFVQNYCVNIHWSSLIITFSFYSNHVKFVPWSYEDCTWIL